MGIENLPIDVECEKCGKEFETTVDIFQQVKEAKSLLLCPNCYVEVLDEQAEMEKPPKRCFEYKYYTLTTFTEAEEDEINKLGLEGWELVTLYDNSTGIFKREYFRDTNATDNHI